MAVVGDNVMLCLWNVCYSILPYLVAVSKPCPYDGDFKCNDTGVCLRSTDVCDGYSECQNRYRSDSDYDEHNCGMFVNSLTEMHSREIKFCIYYINCNPLQ